MSVTVKYALNDFKGELTNRDSIDNQITKQSEDVAQPSPIINILGMGALISLIFAYPISILLYLSKPVPKDKKQKNKFFKKLIFIILIPPFLFLLIYAIARYTMFTF